MLTSTSLIAMTGEATASPSRFNSGGQSTAAKAGHTPRAGCSPNKEQEAEPGTAYPVALRTSSYSRWVKGPQTTAETVSSTASSSSALSASASVNASGVIVSGGETLVPRSPRPPLDPHRGGAVSRYRGERTRETRHGTRLCITQLPLRHSRPRARPTTPRSNGSTHQLSPPTAILVSCMRQGDLLL